MAKAATPVHMVGLTPNHMSALGIFFALLAGGTYGHQQSLPFNSAIVAAFFMLISGFFDALDGALARRFGKATAFGGFLDSLLDRYADTVVFLGLMLGGLVDLGWALLALTGSLLVSYSRARAEAAGVKMETVGLAERAERIIILVTASFLTIVWKDALRWSMVILASLTNLTVLQRALYFKRAVERKER